MHAQFSADLGLMDDSSEQNHEQPADASPLDDLALRPGQEPLTAEEKERFLARARARGRSLTSDEMYAIFGPPPEPQEAAPSYTDVEPTADITLDEQRLVLLRGNFFPELGEATIGALPLIRGLIFDFDATLAVRTRPLDDLMGEGALAAEAYMRSTGMDLPEDFATSIVEARRFAEEKSAEEQEEHIADDALSFLLQFFGYPASRMNPDVLRRAVDIFYAPEMTAWKLRSGTVAALETLRASGYRLAIMANHSCDRVFQRTIDYLNLRAFFDICLSSASVEYRKPDARFLQIVLERWDFLAYETVVIGDSLSEDIRAGIDLGAQTVLVRGATSSSIDHENQVHAGQIVPDAVIDELSALPEVVLAWR